MVQVSRRLGTSTAMLSVGNPVADTFEMVLARKGWFSERLKQERLFETVLQLLSSLNRFMFSKLNFAIGFLHSSMRVERPYNFVNRLKN